MKAKAIMVLRIAVPAVLVLIISACIVLWNIYCGRFDKYDENYLLFSKYENQSNYHDEENNASYTVVHPELAGSDGITMGDLHAIFWSKNLADIKTTEDAYSISVIIKPQLFGGYEVQFEITQAVNIRYLETVGYHTADSENVCNVTFDENLQLDKDATQEQKEEFERYYDMITEYCAKVDAVWDIFGLE